MNPGSDAPQQRLPGHETRAGHARQLGATPDPEGVNFAVFSAHAVAMDLCLFTDDGKHERARLPFQDRDGDIWHMHVAGLVPGACYGLRAHGAYAPEAGQRFNPNKLLMDPYARQFCGNLRWSDLFYFLFCLIR